MHYRLCGLSCGWSSSLAKGDDRRPWLTKMVDCQRARKKCIYLGTCTTFICMLYDVVKKVTRNENILSKLWFLNASLE